MKTRDLELLSAYLDGVLSPEQTSRLEMRLKADPQLRAELEALQRTRALLRQMPRRRVPRNFMLSPRQVAKRPPMPRFYPLLQWSIALTMVLLAVSLGLQFVPSPALTPKSMPAMRVMSAEATEEPLFSLMAETPTSAPLGGGREATLTPAPVQPGIMALPQETPVPKVPSVPTAAPLTEAEEAPPAELPSTLEQPLSLLPLIAMVLALLIVLELLFLLFLRWWSARRWRNWS